MIYVFEKGGRIVFQVDKKPKVDRYIKLQRMIPKPVRLGYNSILNANFDTGAVWYDLALTLDGAKSQLKSKINEYDTSENVNSFTINLPGGEFSMWLSRETRTALKARFEAEIAVGKTSTTLWEGGLEIPLPLDLAQQMLIALELYAAQCYDRTQQHYAAADKIETIEEAESYDYKTGYPNKPIFNP